MKQLHRSKLKEAGNIFLDGVIFRNPVVIGALGLYPVVAAGYHIQNGIFLSVMMGMMMLPVCVISHFIGKNIPNWLRPGLMLVLSGLFYIPAKLAAVQMFSENITIILYSALMISNSIILSRSNDYAPTHSFIAVIADSLGCTLGFAWILCLFSIFRELLATGSLWEKTFGSAARLQYISQAPFCGLILLGFVCAFIQHLNRKRAIRSRKGARV